MARLIIKSKEQTPQILELNPGVNRFGRSPANDHIFEDAAISDQHCEILVDGDFLFVRDLGSTNGTFIERELIKESAFYTGQTLRIGPIEMTLDAPAVHLTIPELPVPEPPPELVTSIEPLPDGYAACLKHSNRHAVWECTHCQRAYCDECIHKLRRVGGNQVKLCPSCSNPCKLSPWSEMLKNQKKSIFGALVGKLKTGFKRTIKMD